MESITNRSYVKALVHTDSDNAPPVFDAEAISSSSAPSKRSTSSVKRVAVLHDIGGDIFFRSLSDNAEELGTEGRQLSWDLDDSSSGLKTVPKALWDGDKSCRESSRRTSATPFHFDDTQDRDIGDLRSELSCIKEVVRKSRRCDEESEPEAEWTSAVHGLLLRSVFGGKDGSVGNRCMWEAPLPPSLANPSAKDRVIRVSFAAMVPRPNGSGRIFARPLPPPLRLSRGLGVLIKHTKEGVVSGALTA